MTPLTRRVRRTRPWLVVALLAALVAASAAQATSFDALDLEERLLVAEDVFVGRVTSVRGERRGDDPWTLVNVEVDVWLLREGTPTEVGPSEVRLAFLGGQAAGVAPRQVAGFPSFAVGDRLLLATYGDDSEAASALVGVTQGLWRDDGDIWRDEAGEALAVDSRGRPHLAGDGDPEAVWLPALVAHLRELRGEP